MTDTKTASQVLSDDQIHQLWCSIPTLGGIDEDIVTFARAILAQQAATPAPAAQESNVILHVEDDDEIGGSVESISACLGDDAAMIREEHPEIAANMDQAAEVLESLAAEFAARQPQGATEQADIESLLVVLGQAGIRVYGGTHGDPWTIKHEQPAKSAVPAGEREALQHVVDCWEAAEVEGLQQALSDARDYSENTTAGRLADFLNRRISHGIERARAVLAQQAAAAPPAQALTGSEIYEALVEHCDGNGICIEPEVIDDLSNYLASFIAATPSATVEQNWWNIYNYQTLFNAIAKATKGIAENHVEVSVTAFRKAMDDTVRQTSVPEEAIRAACMAQNLGPEKTYEEWADRTSGGVVERIRSLVKRDLAAAPTPTAPDDVARIYLGRLRNGSTTWLEFTMEAWDKLDASWERAIGASQSDGAEKP